MQEILTAKSKKMAVMAHHTNPLISTAAGGYESR